MGKKDVCVFTKCSALSPAVQLFVLYHKVVGFFIINYSIVKNYPWSLLSICWVGYNLLGNTKGYWMYLLKIQCHVLFCFLNKFYFSNILICFLPLNLQPLSNAYHELAQVYSTNNPSELRNLVNKHSETFTRDNNMGLVKQCLSSLYKKNIQRLTKVRHAALEAQNTLGT